MTINEIVTNILNLKSGGIQSDDESFRKRQMIFIVNYVRAKLIKEQLDKQKAIGKEWIQPLGCLPLVLADKSECCNVKAGCYVLRTKNKIPAPLRTASGSTITYVGRVDRGKSWPIEDFHRIEWKRYDKWTSFVQVAYYLNGYIYITDNTILNTITVDGVFENPIEVSAFDKCDSDGNTTDTPCYDPVNDDYPIDAATLDTLTHIILTREAIYQAQMPQDIRNNAIDDIKLGIVSPSAGKTSKVSE